LPAVTAGLDAAGVAWTRNARLVRGLDYYRHTAFEFVTDRLGAQGTVLAGGRYDGLVESLGGAPTAGVGWAAGVERLAMLLDEPPVSPLDVIVALEDDALIGLAFKTLRALRSKGFSADLIASGSPRKRYDKAMKVDAEVLASVTRNREGAPVINTRSAAATETSSAVLAILEGLAR